MTKGKKSVRIIPIEEGEPGSLTAYRGHAPSTHIDEPVPANPPRSKPVSPMDAFASEVTGSTQEPARSAPNSDTVLITIVRGTKATTYRVPRERRP